MTHIESAQTPDYLMGHSGWEIARLQLQATMLAPITRRLLHEAGLQRGMRVLDIGCGTGDVSVMIADIVGKQGKVVGIDRSDIAIKTARQRFGSYPNIQFAVGTLDDLLDNERFDLAFGRYVLIHQPEPSEMLRQAAALVHPGGALAFHEIVLSDGFPTSPSSPLWDRLNRYYVQAFEKRLRHCDIAKRFVACFAAVGLGTPKIISESIVGDGAASTLTPWFVETIRTLIPELVASFGVNEEELAIDTLLDRLREESRTCCAQVSSSRQIGAWVTV
ncbi:class I SAM-dependent methyltransferase [Labrys monachus]|uniref:Ubiquinone/menaquinone biosynthesis C-methylase UbiE n=1 Tax=Labrys monachus TaxID=217067 RepID=A0ABU0FB14_9HYPH|nr:methyltransferase domain-containing protein [Labrys monachus]MDQ0391807.1 ubiquinone/menaquinone biosynthesis C-methylase UbiE [Labrys monachus]